MLIPILSIGITKVHAHRAAHGSLDTYYEIEFADNTTDERFTGENYTTGEAIEFLFRLEKKFKDEEQNEIDAYSLRLTKEDMDKSDMNLPEDLKFITKEMYPYYETPNIETLQMISLTSNSLIQDYYVGDLSERKEVKVLNEEEANVIVLSAPIFKLNRNVEKTVVDYEGDLSEETKNEIISRVKEANPNISNMKEIYISENKL
ncbi:MAG: cell surface protein, partial [Erysipelotrichaceae bacterium]